MASYDRPPLRNKNPFCLWRWSAEEQNLRIDIFFAHSKQHQPIHCLLVPEGSRLAGSRPPRSGEPVWPFFLPLSFQSCDSRFTGRYKLCEDWCKTLLCKLLWFPLEESGKLFMDDISELLLIHFIRCLSLNNVTAISLLLWASCMEIRLMIGFDFQLCGTWLQVLDASKACPALGKLGRQFFAPSAVQAKRWHFFYVLHF